MKGKGRGKGNWRENCGKLLPELWKCTCGVQFDEQVVWAQLTADEKGSLKLSVLSLLISCDACCHLCWSCSTNLPGRLLSLFLGQSGFVPDYWVKQKGPVNWRCELVCRETCVSASFPWAVTVSCQLAYRGPRAHGRRLTFCHRSQGEVCFPHWFQ